MRNKKKSTLDKQGQNSCTTGTYIGTCILWLPSQQWNPSLGSKDATITLLAQSICQILKNMAPSVCKNYDTDKCEGSFLRGSFEEMTEHIQYHMVQVKIQHQNTTTNPCNRIKDRNPPWKGRAVHIIQVSKSIHNSLKHSLQQGKIAMVSTYRHHRSIPRRATNLTFITSSS